MNLFPRQRNALRWARLRTVCFQIAYKELAVRTLCPGELAAESQGIRTKPTADRHLEGTHDPAGSVGRRTQWGPRRGSGLARSQSVAGRGQHTLVLSGHGPQDPRVGPVEAVLVSELEAAGSSVRIERLPLHRMGYCVGCFDCWIKTPGECRQHDDGWSLGAAVLDADLLVFSGEIRFGGYTSELKKGVDRLLGLLLPFFTVREGETHHPGRYARYPALLGLGVQLEDDEEERRVYRELVRRNALNLCAPRAHACVIAPGESARSVIRAGLAALERREATA